MVLRKKITGCFELLQKFCSLPNGSRLDRQEKDERGEGM
jgi:hypothetical protein